MNVSDTVRQWIDGGALTIESQRLTSILLQRRFTREQIMLCFETIVHSGCINLAMDLERIPTLDEFRFSVDRMLQQETPLIELCLGIADNADRPANAILDDLIREAENHYWQNDM